MAKRLYLQQLGLSWYLRVKVPSPLQSKVGNTHIRRALGTRDLDEANRRKWPALAQVREYFDALSTGDSTQRAPASLQLGSGHAIAQLPTPLNPDLRPHDGLDGLAEEWALTSSSKTTQFQRRQVYAQLRAFLGRNVRPESVTDAQAATFVDTQLATSRYSLSTRRYRLSALCAFWGCMGTKRYAPRDRNPWKGFRLQSTENGASQKRPYSMDELVTLFSGSPNYPTLREVMALGLYTGARIDEICSLIRVLVKRWQRAAARRTFLLGLISPSPSQVVSLRSPPALSGRDPGSPFRQEVTQGVWKRRGLLIPPSAFACQGGGARRSGRHRMDAVPKRRRAPEGALPLQLRHLPAQSTPTADQAAATAAYSSESPPYSSSAADRVCARAWA